MWCQFIGEDCGQLRLSSEPKEYTIERIHHWLQKQVAPTMKLLLKLDHLQQTDFVNSAMETAELSNKQEKLLEEYVLAGKNMLEESASNLYLENQVSQTSKEKNLQNEI